MFGEQSSPGNATVDFWLQYWEHHRRHPVLSISFPEAERGSCLPVVCPKKVISLSDE
jgi:hypothetical protein